MNTQQFIHSMDDLYVKAHPWMLRRETVEQEPPDQAEEEWWQGQMADHFANQQNPVPEEQHQEQDDNAQDPQNEPQEQQLENEPQEHQPEMIMLIFQITNPTLYRLLQIKNLIKCAHHMQRRAHTHRRERYVWQILHTINTATRSMATEATNSQQNDNISSFGKPTACRIYRQQSRQSNGCMQYAGTQSNQHGSRP
jgi:hypothetical protein